MSISVILVENDEVQQREFSDKLHGSHFELLRAFDDATPELYAAYRELSPEILVVSVVLPSLGGKDIVKQILKINQKAKIAISYDIKTQYLVMDSIKAGAVGRIKKPFGKHTVVERLAEAMAAGTGEGHLSVNLKRPLVLHYKRPDQGIFSKAQTAVASSIGKAGLEMVADEFLQENMVLRLTIEIPNALKEIKLEARVKKVKTIVENETYMAELGFLNTTEEQRELIRAYILEIITQVKS